MVVIQNSPQTTGVLLPSGSCSADASVPGGHCYATIQADTLLAFSSSKADHHLPVRCTGENAQFSSCPEFYHSTPDILRVVTTLTSPAELTSNRQCEARQLQGFSRQVTR
jgi:hypothetical protein